MKDNAHIIFQTINSLYNPIMHISIYFTAHLADNKGCDSEYLKCYPDHCSGGNGKPTAVSVGQDAVTVCFSDTTVTQIDCYED